MQKRNINGYFNFTRKERNGTIYLLLFIVLLTTLPFLYGLLFKEKISGTGDLQKELFRLKAKEPDSSKRQYQSSGREGRRYDQPFNYRKNTAATKGSLFNFDPNTLSAAGWTKLGMRDKTIQTIQNFISKGGRFRKPEDLEKIWGLHPGEVKRLMPYVSINETVKTPADEPAPRKENKLSRPFVAVDINRADSNALMDLPGIGSKLSGRIINFRDRLGGFYRIDQVGETFGLQDSVFQKIKPYLLLADKTVKQININTATQDELKMHPYIRYNLARLIVQYRTQHGNFSNVAALKNIMTVTESMYEKLVPYLLAE